MVRIMLLVFFLFSLQLVSPADVELDYIVPVSDTRSIVELAGHPQLHVLCKLCNIGEAVLRYLITSLRIPRRLARVPVLDLPPATVHFL